MKIKSRLIFLYGVAIVVLIVVSLLCVQAIIDLNNATLRLSHIHTQSLKAEKLRANIFIQTGYASDFLIGDKAKEELFYDYQSRTVAMVAELKDSSFTGIELEFIEGLDETQKELVWIMNGVFNAMDRLESGEYLQNSLERLREIGDEVSDEITALNQYYNGLENEALEKSAGAGRLVSTLLIISILVGVTLFISIIILLQRWLVKPIRAMDAAAIKISSGSLDVEVPLTGDYEWDQLAATMNEMVESLKISREKLKSQERLAAVGEIALYTAHNIRNPLAGIRSAVQVMSSNDRSADEREMMVEIIETIDRLDNWLVKLLEFTKPVQPVFSRIDINDLIVKSTSDLKKAFRDRNISIINNLSADVGNLSCDPILIEQLFSVVLTNAFEAVTNNGEIIITTKLQLLNDKTYILIQVEDDGIGFPEKQKDKLFKPYVTGKTKGTGLGLAQAKKIADAHDGLISLESSAKQGARVKIMLPVDSKNDAEQ